MAAIIIGLAVIGLAAWIWSSRRVHNYFWNAYQRGPHLPGFRRIETRDRAVLGCRLAAALTAAAGVFSVVVGSAAVFG